MDRSMVSIIVTAAIAWTSFGEVRAQCPTSPKITAKSIAKAFSSAATASIFSDRAFSIYCCEMQFLCLNALKTGMVKLGPLPGTKLGNTDLNIDWNGNSGVLDGVAAWSPNEKITLDDKGGLYSRFIAGGCVPALTCDEKELYLGLAAASAFVHEYTHATTDFTTGTPVTITKHPNGGATMTVPGLVRLEKPPHIAQEDFLDKCVKNGVPGLRKGIGRCGGMEWVKRLRDHIGAIVRKFP